MKTSLKKSSSTSQLKQWWHSNTYTQRMLCTLTWNPRIFLFLEIGRWSLETLGELLNSETTSPNIK